MDPIVQAGKRAKPDQALQLFRECTENLRRSRSGLGDTDMALEKLAVRFSELLGIREPQRA